MYLLYFLYNLFSAGRWGRISFCNHTPSLLEATSTKVKTICKISCSPFFSFLFFFLPMLFCVILPLLECVSKAHGMGICPSSAVLPSVVRVAIISESIGWISFNFSCCLPLAICPDIFVFNFEKKNVFQFFTIFFSFSLTWSYGAPKGTWWKKKFWKLFTCARNTFHVRT